MPDNNFLIFDSNKSNMSSDTEYASDSQRASGVQSGIASSKLQNKTLYQLSTMCVAMANFINSNGLNATDTSASALSQNLLASVLGKISDKSGTLSDSDKNVDNKFITPKTLFEFNDNYSLFKMYKMADNLTGSFSFSTTNSTINSNMVIEIDYSSIPNDIFNKAVAIYMKAQGVVEVIANAGIPDIRIYTIYNETSRDYDFIYRKEFNGLSQYDYARDNFSLNFVYCFCHPVKYQDSIKLNSWSTDGLISNKIQFPIQYSYTRESTSEHESRISINFTPYLLYLNI